VKQQIDMVIILTTCTKAAEAEAKGIKTAFINEDTSLPSLWVNTASRHVQLVCMTPEMALSLNF
jgi:hypothetical protein